MYYMAFWFAELDSRVDAAGQRVFNLSSNGNVLKDAVDLFARFNALYIGYQIYTGNPHGPYKDKVVIEAYNAPTSIYPASIAGVEVLQLFDHAMNATTPTFSLDGTDCTS